MMRRRSRHLLIMTLFFSPVHIKAQSVIKLTDSLINELRKSTREPIIRFSYPRLRIQPVLRYEADTSMQFIISYMEYVMFRKSGKTYARKIVDHFNYDASNFQQVISESIFFDDTLYRWLSSKIPVIRNEKILPFEYYDWIGDTMVYPTSSHPFIVGIGIYSYRETFEKDVNNDDLRKWILHYRNLNLEANIKTTLFSFYQKLEEYFRANDHRFKFLKYNPLY